jgi:hypothetical protein
MNTAEAEEAALVTLEQLQQCTSTYTSLIEMLSTNPENIQVGLGSGLGLVVTVSKTRTAT